MANLSRVYSLLLLITCCNAVTLSGKTKLNHQERLQLILYDITSCISRYHTIYTHRSIQRILFCMMSKISHCVQHEAPDYIKRDHLILCGIFSKHGRKHQEPLTTIALITYNDYVLNFDVNKFDFEWHRSGCTVHNMIVFDSADNKSSLYCGKRLPWTMTAVGHKASIHITTSPYRHYHITSFYSSYKPLWLSKFLLSHRVYNMWSAFLHLSLFPVSHRFKIDVVSFYLIVDPWLIIIIDVSWNVSASNNTSITIHDGPGQLSSTLAKYTAKTSSTNFQVKTTTFSAFIQIKNPPNVKNNIQVKTASLSGALRRCRLTGSSFTLSSSHMKNVVCFFEFRSRNYGSETLDNGKFTYYAVFYIETFTLNGPHILVDDSPHNCQYGGMYVSHLIDVSYRMVPMCDNKYRHFISSRHIDMGVLIVWYAGYTSGAVRAGFTTTYCFITYLELNDYPHYLKNRSVSVNESITCQRFVCAPREKIDQNNCKIAFTTETIGTAYMRIGLEPTPSNCIPEYSRPISEQIIQLKTTFNENWPLEKPITVNRYAGLDKSRQLRQVFLYLHNATAVFKDVCIGVGNKQMMLRLEVSSCQKTIQGKNFLFRAGYINAASAVCDTYKYVIKHYLENATHLVYKEGITENIGGSLSVSYVDNCPMDCRNYTFVLLILQRRHTRIDEYRAGVDDSTVFLGLSHNGFRLTVIPPDLQCRCDISVRMIPLPYKVLQKTKNPPVYWKTSLGNLYTRT